jgi:hypothetical protein
LFRVLRDARPAKRFRGRDTAPLTPATRTSVEAFLENKDRYDAEYRG